MAFFINILDLFRNLFNEHDRGEAILENAAEEERIEQHTTEENESQDYAWATSLKDAMGTQDWRSFESLLNAHPGAEREEINEQHETLLHLAILIGKVDLAEGLLNKMTPEDLILKDVNGNTSFIIAVESGWRQIVGMMHTKNNNLVRIRGRMGLLPVVKAAYEGNKEMVLYLFELAPEVVLETNNVGAPETNNDGAPETNNDGAPAPAPETNNDGAPETNNDGAPAPAPAPETNNDGAPETNNDGVPETNDDDALEKKKDGACLLVESINSDMYDFALRLLQSNPNLATANDKWDRTGLHTLANRPSAFPSGHHLGFWERIIHACPFPCFSSKQIIEKKLMHKQALDVLQAITTQLHTLNQSQLHVAKAYNAVTQASQLGIVEFVDEVMKCNLDLQFTADQDQRGILALAIMHRQEKVFNLICEMRNLKTQISISLDQEGNNLLHQAAFLIPTSKIYKISGAALQMQHELQWFEEVEKLVPPRFIHAANHDGKTPRALFTEEHKDMVKEGEQWMKGTAQACMVVATLIAAVMFTAAFTVPGGNQGDTGIPIFTNEKAFMVFIVTDALSLFSSCSSLLMFLAILASRYSEQDFLLSLPTKLILGLTTLFISIATMMAAFCATLFIVLRERPRWIPSVCSSLAGVPVGLFMLMIFRLLSEIIKSTCRARSCRRKARLVRY